MDYPVSRRGFLQVTVASGAGYSALVGAGALRALENPNERIVVGVMGTNGRGARLAGLFASIAGCEVGYICDVDERAVAKGVEAVTSQNAVTPRTESDFRGILDDPAVDALVVAAPDHWHAPATILACAAGKHVYVEKPACHNPHEGELMVEAARKHRRVVQVGTQRRSSPGMIRAIERLREGQIGRVLFARGWVTSTRETIGRGQVATVPSWLNYDLWQGPAPEREYRDNLVHYHWHWLWHWGTGELGNNGVHALDLCRWGLGVDYPERVTCSGGKFFFDDDQETPDTQLATFTFGDKAICWEHRTWHPRGFEGMTFGAVFYGDQGTLVLGSDSYAFYDRSGKGSEPVSTTIGDTDHQRDFLDCIRSGEQPRASIDEGVKSTHLCLLGNIAYRSGRTVNVDSATGSITGDEEQLTYWGREYRPGWEPVV